MHSDHCTESKTSRTSRLDVSHRKLSTPYGSTCETPWTIHSDSDVESETRRASRSDASIRIGHSRRSEYHVHSSASSRFEDDADGSWKGPHKLLGGLTGLLGALTVLPARTPLSLNAPISEMTPLSVACVVPSQPQTTVNETILALRQAGNSAQLLILPETALVLGAGEDRGDVIALVQHAVCEQYGAYVLLSMESPAARGKARNEVVLLGPHGVVDSYVKTSLFPGKQTSCGVQWCPTDSSG